VPAIGYFTALENYLIDNGYTYDGGATIGKAMAANTDWRTCATTVYIGGDLSKNNSSGFSALPGGVRYPAMSSFNLIGIEGDWWSGTAENGSVWGRSLNYHSENIGKPYANKGYGFSVRLVRNSN
jgi:hypothetical protein